jgi:hypothetical protein
MEAETRRLKQFRAWEKVLSAKHLKARNRFHELGDTQKPRLHESTISAKGTAVRNLMAEFDAWDALSDVAFEGFEDSLG